MLMLMKYSILVQICCIAVKNNYNSDVINYNIL